MTNHINRLYRKHMYRRETNYMIDHFTLHTSNPEINENLNEFRATHLSKITNLLLYLLAGHAVLQLTIYTSNKQEKGSSSAFDLVLSFVYLLMPIFMKIVLRNRCINLASYTIYAFFFVYSAVQTAQQRDWTPWIVKLPIGYDNCIWGAYTICMFAPN